MNEAALQPAELSRNQLLAALPAVDVTRWRQHLEPVSLRCGDVLCEPGRRPAHAVFPTSATVSLLYTTREGESAEFAVVGNDGVVGLTLFMGGQATPGWAVVQSAGFALRMPAQAVAEEAARVGVPLAILMRYAEAMIAQVALTAVCNRHHTIDQRLCRRLLMALDRTDSRALATTQEALAHLLGVRREGVTAAALKLQEAGVMRYSRGRIEVLDRRGLEQRTCECYAVARREHERLLPSPVPLSLAA